MDACHPGSLRARWSALGILVVGLLIAACASSAVASQPGGVQRICQQVAVVLSDGPDPSADPVGYAEAQVLPLGQIQSSDPDLRTDIADLASAYQQVYESGGSSAAERAVTVAATRLDVICPGTAP